MSTSNFKAMEYDMPLICGGLASYEEMAKLYEEETGQEYSDSLYYWDIEDEFRRAENIAGELTENLIFHKISVESGYYQGFQFCVEETYSDKFDLDKSSRYCIDNYEAHYYFDMYRSEAIRKADAEKRKIEKMLKALKNRGFIELCCTARFSNGETFYSKV